MKKTLYRALSFLVCFSLLSVPVMAGGEEAVPEAGTHIALITAIDADDSAWGKAREFRDKTAPMLTTALLPYAFEENTTLTSYTLGVEKNGKFKDQRSSSISNLPLTDYRDVEKACSGLLFNSSVENTDLALNELQTAILTDTPADKRLEVWVVYDSTLFSEEFMQLGDRFYFFDTLLASGIEIKFICLSSSPETDPVFSYPETLKKVHPEASISWTSFNPDDAASVAAAANANLQRHYSAYIELPQEVFTCTVQSETQYEGLLSIAEEGTYVLYIPSASTGFSLTHYEPVPVEEAPAEEAPVKEGPFTEAETTEEPVAEPTPEPIPFPTYNQFSSSTGTWIILSDCAPDEYFISFSGKKLPTDINLHVFTIPETSDQQVALNDTPISGNTAEGITLHRCDNIFTVRPGIKLRSGALWNVRALLDNKILAQFPCTAKEDGSISFELGTDELVNDSTLQFQLWLTPLDTSIDQGMLFSVADRMSVSPIECLYLETTPEYTVTVTNRLPVAAESQVFTPLLYFKSADDNTEQQPASFDLSAMVSDADKDSLAYALIDEHGNAVQQIETDEYSTNLDGSVLYYHPIVNSLPVSLKILVDDHDSVAAASREPVTFGTNDNCSFEIIVNQYDISVELAALPFMPFIPEENASNDAEFDLAGSPAIPLTFAIVCDDVDTLGKLATSHQVSDWQSNEFLSLFTADVCYKALSKDVDAEPVALICNVQMNENGIVVPIEIPASICAVDYEISYQISFAGEPLPSAAGTVKGRVANTAPVLSFGNIEKIKGELQGKPDEWIALPLSDIIMNNTPEYSSSTLGEDGTILDLKTIFTDLETQDALTYEITITSEGGKQQIIAADGTVVNDNPEKPGVYLLDDSVLNIQFEEIGEYNISVRAFDGELFSEDSWTINISISSAYTKMLIILGICILAAILLLIAILIIIQHNKPAFVNAHLSIVTSEDVHEAKAFCLDPFKKKSVNLRMLIIATGKPPVPGIPMEALKDIEIFPQKGSKVKVVIGKTAANSIHVKGQNTLKPIVSCEPVFICVNNNESKGLKLNLTQNFSSFG